LQCIPKQIFSGSIMGFDRIIRRLTPIIFRYKSKRCCSYYKKIVNGLQLDYQVNLCFYLPLYCSLIQLGFGFELTRSGFKTMLCIVWEIWLFVTNIASLKYFLSSRAIIGSITCSLINDNLPWINSLQIVLWIKYVILFHNLNSNASFN